MSSLSSDQSSVVQYIATNPTKWVLVHGAAGTGKSLVRDVCVRECRGTNTIILGPNSLSVDNITNCNDISSYVYTVSRFLGIIGRCLRHQLMLLAEGGVPECMEIDTTINEKTIRNSQIFITRCEMVNSADFSGLHHNLCKLLGNQQLFGGIRVVMFCDFRQLRPIDNKCFWITDVFKRYCEEFTVFELNVANHRLTDPDPEAVDEFQNLLTAMRTRTMHTNSRAAGILNYFINARKIPKDVLRLCATREVADDINTKTLRTLDGIIFCLKGKKSIITLKIGAKIQLTRNIYTQDIDETLLGTNGALGVVLSIDYVGAHIEDDPAEAIENENLIIIKATSKTNWRVNISLDSNESVLVLRPTEFYTYHPETGKKQALSYQWPIQLAFALTINRVVGSSLDKVCIIGKDLYDAQKAYTACSRVHSLHGLYCQDLYPNIFYPKIDIISKDPTELNEVKDHKQFNTHTEQLLDTFLHRCGFN